MRTREIRDPETFTAVLGALTDAYYGSPEVAARCATLAEAGPKPAIGRFFDPALLDGVRARAAGN